MLHGQWELRAASQQLRRKATGCGSHSSPPVAMQGQCRLRRLCSVGGRAASCCKLAEVQAPMQRPLLQGAHV